MRGSEDGQKGWGGMDGGSAAAAREGLRLWRGGKKKVKLAQPARLPADSVGGQPVGKRGNGHRPLPGWGRLGGAWLRALGS